MGTIYAYKILITHVLHDFSDRKSYLIAPRMLRL